MPNADAARERDPVCGMAVNPQTTVHLAYGGRLYDFCSSGCYRRFQEGPERAMSERSARAGAAP